MTKESIKQAVKFGLVGVFNTFVDYAVFYIFIAFLHTDKSVSQVFATAVAMSGSYLINKRWTFGETGKSQKRRIVKFVITNIVSMVSTIIFMSLFYDLMKLHLLANSILISVKCPFVLSEDAGVMCCKILASCFSMVINFVGNKFWVFKK